MVVPSPLLLSKTATPFMGCRFLSLGMAAVNGHELPRRDNAQSSCRIGDSCPDE